MMMTWQYFFARRAVLFLHVREEEECLNEGVNIKDDAAEDGDAFHQPNILHHESPLVLHQFCSAATLRNDTSGGCCLSSESFVVGTERFLCPTSPTFFRAR